MDNIYKAAGIAAFTIGMHFTFAQSAFAFTQASELSVVQKSSNSIAIVLNQALPDQSWGSGYSNDPPVDGGPSRTQGSGSR